MKKDILNYFKTDRTYKVGIALYMLYGNRVSFKKQLNIQSETKEMKETLFEELRAIAEIDQKELQAILKTPVKKVPAGEVTMEEQLDPLEVPGSEEVIPEEEQPVPEPEPQPEIPQEEQPVPEPEPQPEIPQEEQPVPEPEPQPEIPQEEQPVPEPEPQPEIPQEEQPVPEPELKEEKKPAGNYKKPKRR